MTTFERDQTVYLIDGQEAEYVADAGGGLHIVRAMFGGEDQEPHWGSPQTVRDVFAAPPVPRYDEQVAKLLAEVAELADKRLDAQKALAGFAKEERERRDRIAMHGHLETIDNLLSGKITHAVIVSYDGVSIRTLDQLVKGDWGKVYSLVLDGRVNGEGFSWKVSGEREHRPNLFTCLEDAQAFAAKAIEERFAALRKGNAAPGNLLGQYKAAGREPPADLVARQHQHDVEKLKGEVHRAEQTLAVYRSALATVEAKAPKTEEA